MKIYYGNPYYFLKVYTFKMSQMFIIDFQANVFSASHKLNIKPVLQGSIGTSLAKTTGYLGHAINAASVYGTFIDEGYVGAKTKEAGAKALTGWAGAGA